MRNWKHTEKTNVDKKSKILEIRRAIVSSTQHEDIKTRTKATQTKQQSNQRSKNKRINQVSIIIGARIKDNKRKKGN